MHRDQLNIRVDATPRRADGEYMAHGRISVNTADGSQMNIYVSGDLAGFDLRGDAVAFAKNWANDLLDFRFGRLRSSGPDEYAF